MAAYSICHDRKAACHIFGTTSSTYPQVCKRATASILIQSGLNFLSCFEQSLLVDVAVEDVEGDGSPSRQGLLNGSESMSDPRFSREPRMSPNAAVRISTAPSLC